MGPRRCLAVIVLSITAGSLVLASADASLFLRFDPAKVRRGEFVVARTEGNGAFRPVPTEEQFPVLFVIVPTRRDLAVLKVDETGNGSARFRVPKTFPIGSHQVWADCPSCSPPGTSPVGVLVVVGDESRDTSDRRWPDARAVAPLILLVVAAGVWLLSRRRTPPPTP